MQGASGQILGTSPLMIFPDADDGAVCAHRRGGAAAAANSITLALTLTLKPERFLAGEAALQQLNP